METSMEVFKKLKMQLPYDSAILLLDIQLSLLLFFIYLVCVGSLLLHAGSL